MKKAWALLGAVIIIASNIQFVFAYQNLGTPSGFVNDYANILSIDERTTLENKLVQYESATSNEISIVTISTLDGDTIENFAVQLFEDWQIGKKNKDNGVLVLLAMQERQMRIEVGYGLEPVLTDAQSSWIIRNTLTPAFREQQYFSGLNVAVDQIMQVIGGEFVVDEEAEAQRRDRQFSWLWGILLFSGVINLMARSWGKIAVSGFAGFLMWLVTGSFMMLLVGMVGVQIVSLLIMSGFMGGGRFGRGGGGGGGSFGGFGGGRSGGGGSSGSW